MKEKKVLFILENFYGYMRGRLRKPVYDLSFINLKNATYSRIIPHFKDTNFKLYFGETTPNISTDRKEKFPIDLNWLKKTIEYDDWFAVISCCKKAEIGLKEIGFEPFMSLPHPASYKWRKELIIDCVNKLKNKQHENI